MKGFKALTAINLVLTLLLCCTMLYVYADDPVTGDSEIKVLPLEYASAAPETEPTTTPEPPVETPATSIPTVTPTVPSEPEIVPSKPSDKEDATLPSDDSSEPDTDIEEEVVPSEPDLEDEVEDTQTKEEEVEIPEVSVEPDDETTDTPEDVIEDPVVDNSANEDNHVENDHACTGDHRFGDPCVESYVYGTFEYIRVDTCEVCGYTVRSHWMIIPQPDPCPNLTFDSTDIFLGILEEFYPVP